MTILRFNHVQLAMPRGLEEQARRFYSDVLGLHEVPKPLSLAARGGAWFDLGGAQLHLGVEADFAPTKKAHVAFDVDNLDALATRCRQRGMNRCLTTGFLACGDSLSMIHSGTDLSSWKPAVLRPTDSRVVV
jgi:catechol 2,3-dioxygenase-like lactoylglutathione lyase family enzyme